MSRIGTLFRSESQVPVVDTRRCFSLISRMSMVTLSLKAVKKLQMVVFFYETSSSMTTKAQQTMTSTVTTVTLRAAAQPQHPLHVNLMTPTK